MKIIYSFLIFGLIYSATIDPTQVIDIYYNVEYLLSQDLSKQFSYYPFRLPVIAGDKMDIEVRVPDDANHNFYLEVYEYNFEPTNDQVYKRINGVSKGKISPINFYYEGQSTVFYNTFKVSEAALPGSYFLIYVTIPNYSYAYLYLRINLSKYKYSNIKDINFRTDYTIDTSIFGDRKIPYKYQIYLRLPFMSEDQMQIQLTTHEAYEKDSAFEVDVCQYDTRPVESQVYYIDRDINCKNNLKNTSPYATKYYYDFQTERDIQYLSIRIINYIPDLNYLFIYIYTEKGMHGVILALLIIAPIIIVGAIIVFILRRLRTSGKKEFSQLDAPTANIGL